MFMRVRTRSVKPRPYCRSFLIWRVCDTFRPWISPLCMQDLAKPRNFFSALKRPPLLIAEDWLGLLLNLVTKTSVPLQDLWHCSNWFSPPAKDKKQMPLNLEPLCEKFEEHVLSRSSTRGWGYSTPLGQGEVTAIRLWLCRSLPRPVHICIRYLLYRLHRD